MLCRSLTDFSQELAQGNIKPPNELACCLKAPSLGSGEVLRYLLRRRLSRKPIAASKGAKRLSRVVRSATGRPSCTAPVHCLSQALPQPYTHYTGYMMRNTC